MGRCVLLTSLCAALVLGACQSGEMAPPRHPDDPHRDLTCAECHNGPLVEADRAAVPQESCTGSGCHEDGGPREVELRSISFEHRLHGGDSVVAMSCAGCHTHEQGSEPLTAGVDPCSLCHLSEQTAGNAGECRLCHTSLDYAVQTSQGMDLPHEALPWMDGGCVRCHYDVTQVPVDVSVLTCSACHEDRESTVARGIGEDLHASHTGVGCISCHAGETHHIQAMSSAVFMECSQCHVQVHGVEATAEFPGTEGCNACHAGTHVEAQGMVLGVMPGVPEPRPSDKFMDGLTCRSCHVPAPGQDPTVSVAGNEVGCQSCHREEYGLVLDWWSQGAAERLTLVRSSLDRARSALAGNDTAAMALDSAALLLRSVEDGHPEHNLRLAHQMMVDASDRISQAYVDARRAAPAPPSLGREPSMGLCSYCHYRLDDPWLFEEMSGPFHREALGLDVRRER